MRQIINGKMYNTDTATLVGVYQYLNCRDFNYERSELYIKKNGEWFRYSEGGPLSSYSEECGSNNWCGGSGIRPLTEEEAKKWLAKNNYIDEYIKYFGEPEE